MKRSVGVAAAGLILLSLTLLSGCSGSEASPFLGEWVCDVEKNMKAIEGQTLTEKQKLFIGMTSSILQAIKLKVTADDATLYLGEMGRTVKYTIEDDLLIIKPGKEKIVFQLMKDGQLAMLQENPEGGEPDKLIMTRKKD